VQIEKLDGQANTSFLITSLNSETLQELSCSFDIKHTPILVDLRPSQSLIRLTPMISLLLPSEVDEKY
jgi:hypothetical protein